VRKQILQPRERILEVWWIDGGRDTAHERIALFNEDGVAVVTFADRIGFLSWPWQSVDFFLERMRVLAKERNLNLASSRHFSSLERSWICGA
jgi:hypothetical protein